jgi:predicted aminopeptidase
VKRVLAAALAALALGGCGAGETVGYYWQSAAGQLDVVARAQPIPDAIAATDDAALKAQLARVALIRAYATSALALPDNKSYTRFSQVDRPFVVWNVFAAPPLSLAPRQWCFPVAGCVNYRGYFREADAQEEAARFRAAGDDVYVSGVPAYSTLGYFDDPVLSTFVHWPEVDVARLVFHELAHQIVYVKDDSVFNESFATAVEEAGVERWLAAQGNPALDAHFARSQRLRHAFRSLVETARAQLADLYAAASPPEAKLAQKAAVMAATKDAWSRAKAGEPGLAGYDRWFALGPNNASLASVALYTQMVPAFRALLRESGDDLPRFYERVKALAAMDKGERNARLAALSAAA